MTSPMTTLEYLIAGMVTGAVVLVGTLAIPVVFAGRVLPNIWLENTALAGVAWRDVPGVLQQYEARLRQQPVELNVREQTIRHTLRELGVALDIPQTTAVIQQSARWPKLSRHQVRPVVVIDSIVLEKVTQTAFANIISSPRNAALQLTPTVTLAVTTSQPGEGIERVTFEEELIMRAERSAWQRPFFLNIVAKPAEIQDHEVTGAKALGEQLLRDGMQLTFDDQQWELGPVTVRRMIEFAEVKEASNPTNHVLGITFNQAQLEAYLASTIAPEVNQTAQNARFAIGEDGKVSQFAVPQRGQELSVAETARQINHAVAQNQRVAPIVVAMVEPSVTNAEDITALGITTLLTTGETDFAGSPRNRIHNITVGTDRYHGLLIPPGQEFSFNEHLGPVTAEAGFKPELVIKHNVTTPEFGGGLCQVSTTLFRAAVQSGLEVTDRRNHAYAVRYYGTPGFDATIYPPYTDLRFINNTPGYILIQSRVEGTRLAFEFWGTHDGRNVEVAGPFPYGREASGAVKATLTQTVTRDGATMFEKKFYSRYKSPALFPKVVAADQGQT